MDEYIKPHFKNSALITIDVQRDTLNDQPLEVPGTSNALPHIKQLLDTYRNCKLPIIYIIRIYKTDGSNVDLCRRTLVEKGTPILNEDSLGAELAKELFDDDIVRYDSKLLLSGGIQTITENEVIKKFSFFSENFISGFAIGKIIKNNHGQAINCELISVNKAFEIFSGNKKITRLG